MQKSGSLGLRHAGAGKNDGPVPFVTSLVNKWDAFDRQSVSWEFAQRIRGARLVWADTEALAADYGDTIPGLSTATRDDPALHKWLIDNGAILSLSQARQTDVNDPVSTSSETVETVRPPRYGRAAILAPEVPGGVADAAGPLPFFDIKGCGVPNDEDPVLPHSNGLLTLREAVYEVILQKLVNSVLRHDRRSEAVLPCYAILDLGFFARFKGHRPDGKAAVLLRRTQTRPAWQWGTENPGRRRAGRLLDFESLLRRRGLSASSCGAVRFKLERQGTQLLLSRDGEPIALSDLKLRHLAQIGGLQNSGGADTVIFDGVNVQVADGLDDEPERFQVMDFGRYRFAGSFDQVLYSWSLRDYCALEGTFSRPAGSVAGFHPDVTHDYAQPDPGANLSTLPETQAYRDIWECVAAYEAGSIAYPAIWRAMDRLEQTALHMLGASPC